MSSTQDSENLAARLTTPGPLGSWVEAHTEAVRGGRTYRLLVNHRTGELIELTDADARACAGLNAGRIPPGPAGAALTAELRDGGFLAASPPPVPPRRGVQASLARLDVRWAGAGRLVRAAHDRGARHLFAPAAVTTQVMLALAGLAAVFHAVTSGQHFQLRVHPAQVPVVIGLSLAAVAVHELAHALVVVRHHRTVDAAGVRLHLGTPAFYIESASAALLNRRQRLIQAGAGVWAEWQFTSAAAIWLWAAPPAAAGPLLHRFVILNAATITTNLLPFTGLDGSWLLADAARVPDLARRSRGAVTRLAVAVAGQQPVPEGTTALAVYSAVNSLAAAGLLGTAGFFWYQLFGGLTADLTRAGPGGWAVLAAAAIVLGRPAASAAAARLPAAGATAHELHAAISFRLQWRWRIPAAAALATAPDLAALTPAQLGLLAGQLHRTRHRGPLPANLTGSHGIVTGGTIIATTPDSEQPRTLTAGATWDSRQLPHSANRRATLIHLPAAATSQLLTSSTRTGGQVSAGPA